MNPDYPKDGNASLKVKKMNNEHLQSNLPKVYAEPTEYKDSYESPQLNQGFFTSILPSLMFYCRASVPVGTLSYQALVGTDDVYAWVQGSYGTFKALEATSCQFSIEGLHNINNVEGPCVFVANHMSTLETFILPCLIQPRKPIIFVVKQSLMRVPFFGKILKSRTPIVVSRSNARQDLKAVLEQGKEALDRGTSILIFPQSTRSVEFKPENFNSIGAKLAKKANVPLLPIALKTDAWGQGKYVKDFGAINPKLRIHFSFGSAIKVEDNSKTAHNYTSDYITSALKKWNNI